MPIYGRLTSKRTPIKVDPGNDKQIHNIIKDPFLSRYGQIEEGEAYAYIAYVAEEEWITDEIVFTYKEKKSCRLWKSTVT